MEAIISSASKKVRCSALLQEAVPVLKKLYHDGSDDHIKVRALVVGHCFVIFFQEKKKPTEFCGIFPTYFVYADIKCTLSICEQSHSQTCQTVCHV